MKVTHKVFGNGIATLDGNYVHIIFDNDVKKTFAYPKAFEEFLTTTDTSFQNKINSDLDKLKSTMEELVDKRDTLLSKISLKKDAANKTTIKPKKVEEKITTNKVHRNFNYKDKHVLFELIGYLCTPNRIASIGACVPDDDRSVEFEMNYPDQPYTKIELKYDEKGHPNKNSCSFSIYFRNIDNCPDSIINSLASAFGYAARLNRTTLIYNLVNNYGFRFGKYQDINNIRTLAAREGYEADFNRGYNL